MPKFGRILLGVVIAATLGALLGTAHYFFWARHEYLITAYCNCSICVNIKEFHDGKFANGKPVYWGGVAADKSIPFGSEIELVPETPSDWFSVYRFFAGRRRFTVEDRGGKIRGRHIDIFFPDSRGGHQTALRWGVRHMRIKINGQWAD